MKRWNYYCPIPGITDKEKYPVTDNENPGYNIYVETESEAERIVNQLNDYETRVNQLTDELNKLKETKYPKSDKMISFEIIDGVIEKHILELRRLINGLGCNKYNDVETYYTYLNRIKLLETVRKELVSNKIIY